MPPIIAMRRWPSATSRSIGRLAARDDAVTRENVFIRQGETVRWAYQRDNGLYWRAYPIDCRPLAPGAITLRLYGEPLAEGTWHHLPVTAHGPTMTLPRTGDRLRETQGVPLVDVVGLLSAERDEVLVFAVNRDLRSARPVELTVSGLTGDVDLAVQAPLDDDPFHRQESWSEQDACVLRHSTVRPDEHGRLGLELPAASVARLRARVTAR